MKLRLFYCYSLSQDNSSFSFCVNQNNYYTIKNSFRNVMLPNGNRNGIK